MDLPSPGVITRQHPGRPHLDLKRVMLFIFFSVFFLFFFLIEDFVEKWKFEDSLERSEGLATLDPQVPAPQV